KRLDWLRRRLSDRPAERGTPQLQRLRERPPLERILQAVARKFGYAEPPWSSGRRSEDAASAVAAFVARRRFGYPAKAVAEALGYADAGGVTHAIRRIESADDALKKTVDEIERTLR
ncbi:MAG TPA: hypothetical protein VMY42_09730, partial [Thermoguttaceae bacterium]|nr:hypothetical protein [Thermoguttaceae bacterium]